MEYVLFEDTLITGSQNIIRTRCLHKIRKCEIVLGRLTDSIKRKVCEYMRQCNTGQKIPPVPRGTSYSGSIALTDEQGNALLLEEDDYLVFGVKSTPYSTDNNFIIKKIITSNHILNGQYIFSLSPRDTNIPVYTYFYDITLHRANGSCYQVVPLGEFKVVPSLTSGVGSIEPGDDDDDTIPTPSSKWQSI